MRRTRSVKVLPLVMAGLLGPAGLVTAVQAQTPAPQVQESTTPQSATGRPKGLLDLTLPPPAGVSDASPQSGTAPRVEELAPVRSAPGLENSSVDVGRLDSVINQSEGLLGPANGGFPENIWENSRPDRLNAVLRDLPAWTGAVVIDDLVRRVLLTRAPAPPRASEADVNDFLGFRFDALYRAGYRSEVEQLTRSSITNAEIPEVVKVQTNIRLIEQDTDAACANAARYRGEASDLYWTKLQTYCYLAVDDRARANLTVDLLRERDAGDQTFITLVANIADRAGLKIDAIDHPTALHLALLRKADLDFPETSLAGAEPIILSALSEGVGSKEDLLSLPLRVEAAEQALEAGAVAGGQLIELYRKVPLEASELAALDVKGREKTDAATRAKLFQAAETAIAPAERAKWMSLAIRSLIAEGRLATASAVYGVMADGLEPSLGLTWAAPQVVPVLIKAGEFQAAEPWLELFAQGIGQGAIEDAEGLAADDVRLYGLIHQLMAGSSSAGDWLLSARDRLQRSTSAKVRERAELELYVLGALGIAMPDDLRQEVYSRQPPQGRKDIPGPDVLSGLEAASLTRKKAETILYAATVLGPDGLRTAHPYTIAAVIGAFQRVGLDYEARDFAIEILLSSL